MSREWESVADALPQQPSSELIQELLEQIYDKDELGENLILYHRESMCAEPPVGRTEYPEDRERRELSRRQRWGAVCTCSYCGEDFEAGWVKGGIVLREGENGQTYDGWAEPETEGTVIAGDGDRVCCPHCWSMGTVTPRRELRRGRTYRIMQAEAVNAGEYTAVMYWMVERRQRDWGADSTVFLPCQALVIDKEGKLRRFRWEGRSEGSAGPHAGAPAQKNGNICERGVEGAAPYDGIDNSAGGRQVAAPTEGFGGSHGEGQQLVGRGAVSTASVICSANATFPSRGRLGGRQADGPAWRLCRETIDPFQQAYYSFDAEFGKQIGGWVWQYGAPLEGHTGEKTALDEYIGAGGIWPGAYLHVWRKWPQVENLMRQGFARAVQETIDRKLNSAGCSAELSRTPPIPWADWGEVKPHRMLGMSREAFRVVRAAGWGHGEAEVWTLWHTVLGSGDALRYEECRKKIGTKNVRDLLGMVQAGWDELEPAKVVRYLDKQGLLEDGVRHLIDYRTMMRSAELAETAETMWPRDLLAAHDRVAQQLAAEKGLEAAGSFAVTLIKLDGLEWSDGRLCIVIPRSERELKDEGNVLRHCVGSYGKTHCSGKPVFFVRHARRPERSYYTLNIDMTGPEPTRIQLHGYGNERHGEHKQYTHSIPKEVLDFCDRWEREVLAPWWKKKHESPAFSAGGRKNTKEVHAA